MYQNAANELFLAATTLSVGAACAADIDNDGAVDVNDLTTLLLNWGCADPPGPCPGDVNQDGVTDVLDLTGLLLAWGPC